MSFIKNHPYWSCTGLAVASNAAVGLINTKPCQVTNEFATGFIIAFPASIIFSTIPAAVVTIVDRLGHQNLFDNKPLQYGLTATESILGQASMLSPLPGKSFSENFTQYFTDLVKMDLSDRFSVFIKSVFISNLIQSLGFKYILDSAYEQNASEQNEIDTQNEGDLNKDSCSLHDESLMASLTEESQVF